MLEIPTTAAGLLAALNEAPDAPEPPPAAPSSSWLDYSDTPPAERRDADAYHLGGYDYAPATGETTKLYSASEAAALARAAVDAAERTRRSARPIVLPPDISRHIVYARQSEPWWMLFAAAGAVSAGMGHVGGVIIGALGAVIAWLLTREG